MSPLLISILIFLAFLFLYIIFRFIPDLNHKNIIKGYEKDASHYEKKIIKNPHKISITSELEALRIMKKRYLYLKHKFRNDPKILVKIAKDWKKYVHLIFNFLSEKQFFEIDFLIHFGEAAAVRFRKRVTPLIIEKDKIEAHFCRLLGMDKENILKSHLKWGSYDTERR